MDIALGVDIGGTSIKVALISRDGKIIDHHSLPIIKGMSQEAIIEALGEDLLGFLSKNHLSKDEIIGIGVGCPGAINSGTGVCDYSNNLQWNNLPIKALLEKKTGLKVRVANDANVAILGEAKFGAGKSYHNLVLLTLGTGVGGGLYLNDHLYEGQDGKGAELGHMVIRLKGRLCTCGRHGCLEAYASVTALIKDTKIAMKKDPSSLMWHYVNYDLNKVDGKTAFESAKLGDKSAIQVRDNYLTYLGEGLLNYCNIFRPEAILLSGGLSNQKEALTDPLNQYLFTNYYGFHCTPKVEVKIASLGADTGIYGGAALAFTNASF